MLTNSSRDLVAVRDRVATRESEVGLHPDSASQDNNTVSAVGRLQEPAGFSTPHQDLANRNVDNTSIAEVSQLNVNG